MYRFILYFISFVLLRASPWTFGHFVSWQDFNSLSRFTRYCWIHTSFQNKFQKGSLPLVISAFATANFFFNYRYKRYLVVKKISWRNYEDRSRIKFVFSCTIWVKRFVENIWHDRYTRTINFISKCSYSIAFNTTLNVVVLMNDSLVNERVTRWY